MWSIPIRSFRPRAGAIYKASTSRIEHSVQTDPDHNTDAFSTAASVWKACLQLLIHMDNTTSPPHSSCISPAATPAAAVSAGENSWAMHFADFLASSSSRQEMSRQGGGASESSFSSGFSSSFDSLGDDDDDDSFITSDLMDEDDEDDSLQDTACSSTAGPKATSMYDMWMKSIVAMDAKKMDTAQLAKYFLDAGMRQQTTGPVQQVISSTGNSNEKQLYECSDLRKKGLCLVPLSMLIDYLG